MYLLLVSILLTGDTFTKIAALFGLLEVNTGSKSTFYSTIIPDVQQTADIVMKKFMEYTRSLINDPSDVFLVFDGAWSHPGWWAKECTVIAVDGKTGLPVYIQHVIKNKNYTGSSKGMEAWGVLQIMTEMKSLGYTVTHILHDKDSSAMKQVISVFQDVQENLCISNAVFKFYFIGHGAKNFKKKLEKLGKQYPEIKKLAERSSKTLANIIKNSGGSSGIFYNLLEKKLEHYCGNHSNCSRETKCNITGFMDTKAEKTFKVMSSSVCDF